MGRRTITATVLVENTAPDGLEAEHGFSVLVSHAGGTLLFDTGASDLFARNARRLSLDLSRVGAVVISHGHHDHAGGVPELCKEFSQIPIWLHRKALNAKYSAHDGELGYAGVPAVLSTACGNRLRYAGDGDSPQPGTYLVRSSGSAFPLPLGNETLYVDVQGGLENDSFDDELSLVVATGRDLMLISGCSHRGIGNIVEATEAMFPEHRIAVLLGGFHTRKDSGEALTAISSRLATIPSIYAGHCTGEDAFAQLQEQIGAAVRPCPVGTTITL